LVDQIEKNVEPFLRRLVGIKAIISRFGIFKTAEQLNDSLHDR